MPIDDAAFEAAVFALANEDGVDSLLTLPGVWEVVSEHYNNAAISRIEDGDSEHDHLPEVRKCRYCGAETIIRD